MMAEQPGGKLEELSGFWRAVIGCLGGAAAVASKYLGQDHAYYLRMLDQGMQSKIDHLWIGYYIMAPLLVFLGALVAWASYEHHRVKLLAIAVAAPALITTWAGGATTATKFTWSIFSPAYAESSNPTNQKSAVGEAVKLWFGIGRDEQQYRVVVGSFKDPAAAASKAAQINKVDPTWKATVGDRRLFNEYYPVVIGGFASYPAAKALKDSVSDKLGTDDVFLAPSQ
jgi:hypothetical protein